MQPGQPGRAASVAGVVLIFMGIVSLSYFASPIRIILRETMGGVSVNLVPPVLGGLALCGGIDLLFFTRQKTRTKKTEL